MTDRAKFTDRGDQCWAVKGGRGAVEFRVIISTDTPVAITLHSADERGAGWRNEDCDLLPGGKCWADCSFAGGRDLFRAWVDERRDDEVIWGCLESWHADRFGASFPDEACAHEPEGREIALDPAGEES